MSAEGVVIVGGSLAGIQTADSLRIAGYQGCITVIDAHPEPHFDRPPLSKDYLAGSVTADRLLLRDRERLEATGAQWLLGHAAESLDAGARTVRIDDGRELGFEHLVIATGVAPIMPPELRVKSAYTLRSKEDSDRLRVHLRADSSLIVIGGGFIGLEVAATFRNAGARVDVVEALPTPLHRQVGAVVGTALQRVHELRGVTFHLGRQAVAGRQDGNGVSVTLDDGTGLQAEALLVAVGSRPGVDWLHGAGLALDRGLLADHYLSAGPGIYGIGDVVRWPHPLVRRSVRIEHWTTAVEQAKYVARRITCTGGDEPFAALPYFWSDQYDRKVQAHGFPSESAELELLDGDLESDKFAVLYVEDGRATAVVGINDAKQVLVGRRRVLADLQLQEVRS